jgi:hypothetical protein
MCLPFVSALVLNQGAHIGAPLQHFTFIYIASIIALNVALGRIALVVFSVSP